MKTSYNRNAALLKGAIISLLMLILIGTQAHGLGELRLTEMFSNKIFATHSPLYPREGEVVTFTADAAADAALTIQQIRFWVNVYPLRRLRIFGSTIVFPSGPPTIYTYSCDYPTPYPATATCAYSPLTTGLPANSYVMYTARVLFSDGSHVRDRKIRFTANLNNSFKSAYKNAFPVYQRGAKSEKFNILFVPDTDYSDEAAYITDIQSMLYGGLLTEDHMRMYRRYLNVYMNDFSRSVSIDNPAAVAGCGDADFTSQDPSNWDQLSDIDVRVYAHATDFQDCAEIGLAGGRRCTSDGSVIRMEMLHALYGLDDEYVTSETSSDASGPHQNVFDTQVACEDHATAEHSADYTTGSCVLLGTGSSLYHWDAAGDCMTDSGAGPMTVEERSQITALIDEQSLSAFSEVRPEAPILQPLPGSTASTVDTAAGGGISNEQNIFPEEEQYIAKEFAEAIVREQQEVQERAKMRTVALKLSFEGPKIRLNKIRILAGAAPHLFFPNQPSDFLIVLMDAKGKVLKKFWTQDPRRIAGEEKGSAGPQETNAIDKTVFDLRFAWEENLAKVVIQNRAGKKLLQIPIRPAPSRPGAAPSK